MDQHRLILTGLLMFCLLMLLWSMVCLDRNRRVFIYRMEMLDEIALASKYDVNRRRDFRWRYRAYRSVPYETMVYHFWKPVSSFIPHPDILTNMHATKEDYDRGRID